ncbi:hypothetical protein CP533_1557 [Ophiocordyceps camponoti-saundersi (nom. inval.)]|nr:hypothetical protein CP533_1557 [Ophiocordyceps camponoti-saundersi (nom. inval.)]
MNDTDRLDAQHLLWTMYQGHVLPPDIPVREDMKIAELGAGTGIWLMDLSRRLPPSVKLDGYDISDKMFPCRNQWPANVTLSKLDSKGHLPPSLMGQYDVVHIRMWATILNSTEVNDFIRGVKKMLKPGGYIFWEDADFEHFTVAPESEDLHQLMQLVYNKAGIMSWVQNLPLYLQQQSFNILATKDGKFKGCTSQLCTNTCLLATKQVIEGYKRRTSNNDVETNKLLEKCEESLAKVLSRFNEGPVYNWKPVSVLGQLPLVLGPRL